MITSNEVTLGEILEAHSVLGISHLVQGSTKDKKSVKCLWVEVTINGDVLYVAVASATEKYEYLHLVDAITKYNSL